MGDRTYCMTTINKHYYKTHKKEFDKLSEDHGFEVNPEDEVVNFEDDQANYGDMPELVDFLSERNIEYDKRWESGGGYSAGNEYARIVDGEYKVWEINEGEEDMIAYFKEILACDPDKREDLIKNKLQQLEPFEITDLKAPQSIDFIKNA